MFEEFSFNGGELCDMRRGEGLRFRKDGLEYEVKTITVKCDEETMTLGFDNHKVSAYISEIVGVQEKGNALSLSFMRRSATFNQGKPSAREDFYADARLVSLTTGDRVPAPPQNRSGSPISNDPRVFERHGVAL